MQPEKNPSLLKEKDGRSNERKAVTKTPVRITGQRLKKILRLRPERQSNKSGIKMQVAVLAIKKGLIHFASTNMNMQNTVRNKTFAKALHL